MLCAGSQMLNAGCWTLFCGKRWMETMRCSKRMEGGLKRYLSLMAGRVANWGQQERAYHTYVLGRLFVTSNFVR